MRRNTAKEIFTEAQGDLLEWLLAIVVYLVEDCRAKFYRLNLFHLCERELRTRRLFLELRHFLHSTTV